MGSMQLKTISAARDPVSQDAFLRSINIVYDGRARSDRPLPFHRQNRAHAQALFGEGGRAGLFRSGPLWTPWPGNGRRIDELFARLVDLVGEAEAERRLSAIRQKRTEESLDG